MNGSVTSDKDTLGGLKAPVTQRHIMLISDEIGVAWRDLGVELRLESPVARNLASDCNSSRDRAWEVVDKWRQKYPEEATVGSLADALVKIGKGRAVQKLVGKENVKAGTVNTEKRLQDLETKVEQLVMEKSTEKIISQGSTHDNTCKGKISDKIDKDPRVIQENIKIVYENEKIPAGRSSELENNTLEEMNKRHLSGRLEEFRLGDRIQKDTMERDQASRRRDGVEVQERYDEMHRCLRCPNLKKELNDLKTERDTLKNKISQLENMRTDEEKTRKDTKTKDEIIRENDIKIANLVRVNKIQLYCLEWLKRKNENIETKKRDIAEEKKKMDKQIGELKAKEEELKWKLQFQTDPEKLDSLKTQNSYLSSQIEELNRKVKSSESECMRLQEKLKKYSNFQSQSRICSRCPGLEKKLSDMNEELETTISQLKLEHEEDKKTRNREEKRKTKEYIHLCRSKMDALQISNQEQLTRIEKLKQKIVTIETMRKEDAKKLEEQIKILKAENEKLMEFKNTQPDSEELSQLGKEKTEMSTKIEEPGERVNKSESDWEMLQEKFDKFVNWSRR